MKTLYIECVMGVAGDMLTAALLELHPEPAAFVERLNSIGLPGVLFTAKKIETYGIQGTSLSVTVDGMEEMTSDVRSHSHHHHHHRGTKAYDHDHDIYHHFHEDHEHCGMSVAEIVTIVDKLDIPRSVKDDIIKTYGYIGDAESWAHGVPVSKIHFSEVGMMDAVADVTAACLLMSEIGASRVVSSPINVGFGQVRCAHGVLPVPAPATAHILRGIPSYGGRYEGELCTPTGAALIRRFADDFGPMPLMSIEAIGYGVGKKDFGAANCVRVMLGEAKPEEDTVRELFCNVDDMTGEAAAFAVERIFEAGALDVWTAPIGMKKGRPGLLISAMCREADKEAVLAAIFRHTTTNGVRETTSRRHVLDREMSAIDTPNGPVRVKTASGFGTRREKHEYEDLAAIARERGISLAEAATWADGFRAK